ncbi:MAG TPA: phage antirepressor protein, partial [Erysipelotrichaceae bacterium]|nr:phage antirepressor protein [Erysipelotrichaceae bacterium]
LHTYFQKGYIREWINQRLQAIQVRKELTDSWINHGIKKVMNLQFLQMKFLKHGVE